MARPTQRQPERIRQVEKCSKCGDVALGTTTVDPRPWDKERPKHSYHFCDPCSETIVLRPLPEVLIEFLE